MLASGCVVGSSGGGLVVARLSRPAPNSVWPPWRYSESIFGSEPRAVAEKKNSSPCGRQLRLVVVPGGSPPGGCAARIGRLSALHSALRHTPRWTNLVGSQSTVSTYTNRRRRLLGSPTVCAEYWGVHRLWRLQHCTTNRLALPSPRYLVVPCLGLPRVNSNFQLGQILEFWI